MVRVSLPCGLVSRPARWMSLRRSVPICSNCHSGAHFSVVFSFLVITVHLHFSIEVVCENGGEEIDLIASLSAGRHVVHLRL